MNKKFTTEIDRLVKEYEPPFLGKQTTQIYHPERGANYYYQVSTYGINGWLQSYCCNEDLSKTKANDSKRELENRGA